MKVFRKFHSEKQDYGEKYCNNTGIVCLKRVGVKKKRLLKLSKIHLEKYLFMLVKLQENVSNTSFNLMNHSSNTKNG